MRAALEFSHASCVDEEVLALLNARTSRSACESADLSATGFGRRITLLRLRRRITPMPTCALGAAITAKGKVADVSFSQTRESGIVPNCEQ